VAKKPLKVAVAPPNRKLECELLSFLKLGEGPITANKLTKRAKELRANATEQDAQYLLAHQEEIPVEAQNFILVFPVGKLRFVAYLSRYGRRWHLHHSWDGDLFGDNARLVRRPEG